MAKKMARPRSGRSRSPRLAGALTDTRWTSGVRLGRRVWRAISGPVGQQFLAFGLIGFGIVSIFTLAGSNSGALINGWARGLVFLFGWGAYLISATIIGLGLLWLRHLVHRATAWRWRPFLGLELAMVGLLTLTHTLLHGYGWELVVLGRGGGLVGWALYIFFDEYFGPLITGLLMAGVAIAGVALAFDVTVGDVRRLGHRLTVFWDALREPLAPEPESEPDSPPAIVAPEPEVAAPPIHTAAQPRPRRAARPAATPAASPAAPAARRTDLPPLTLLREGKNNVSDPEDVRHKSSIIEETLAQFGVPATVVEVRPGPVVTQFGVEPGYISRGADGEDQRKVRVSQIAALANDLTLALAAESLRIEAPVPGRAVVGVEVPNGATSLVALRPVLDSDEFRKCGAPLCFAVGLDVAGHPVVADLSQMPHLLVAGTTGSGKSVFVKALAMSLILHNSPDELRLVTIDPKLVELSHLNGLPHLYGRTETELEKIIHVLRWVAHQMDSRYKLFSASVARNLDDYNRKMARKGEPTLPRLVVLIDELADLMMAAPEETERTLTRIAQMARATGIHLVVATQRPSTDVVTGLIKANFPARVSFATTSSIDSRVVIDTPGAETLLGRGDMLFLRPDAAAPVRVQGCYVSDNEIESVIKFWQEQAGATPAQSPWETLMESSGPEALRIEGQPEDADLLEQAIAIAKKRGKISTSGLQRGLRISYPRAARLMEEMEDMGLVGPQQSAGRKRQVILGGDEGDL